MNFDLGDRVVTVQPRRGHTASDLTVEVDGGEGPVWCGDLVWNAMFPNYVDAIPSRLSRSVRALRGLPATTFVPGHGPLADAEAMARYTAVIDSVEEAARDAIESGRTAQEAAEEYEVPEELGEWSLLQPGLLPARDRGLDAGTGGEPLMRSRFIVVAGVVALLVVVMVWNRPSPGPAPAATPAGGQGRAGGFRGSGQ